MYHAANSFSSFPAKYWRRTTITNLGWNTLNFDGFAINVEYLIQGS